MNASILHKHPFITQVASTISGYSMLSSGDRILIAVSGGPDSVALTLSLLSLSKILNLTLGIAHLNHQLRGNDAKKDEAFVRELAQVHGIACHAVQVDVKVLAEKKKQSIEEAGRDARYDFFKKTCDTHHYTRVATGHTKDDNAELILMNLLRGSGLQGLTGIPPKRENLYIRPLIRASKKDILHFLKEVDQEYRIDDSNTDIRFLRNRIRHHLIPVLEKEYNPSVADSLDRFGRIAALENDYLARQADNALKSCLKSADDTIVTLFTLPLLDLHPALQARVIRLAICRVKADLKRIQNIHLLEILDLCRKKGSKKSLDLPGRIRIYKSKNILIVKKEDQPLRQIGQQTKDKRNKERRQRQSKA